MFSKSQSLFFLLNITLILSLLFPYYLISNENVYFFKSFFFLIIPLCSIYLLKSSITTSYLLIYSNIIYCLSKLLFLSLYYFFPLQIRDFTDFYFNELIFYSNIGFIDVPRFITANDYVTPFCIFFLLVKKKFFWIPILIFSVVLTLSFHLLLVLFLLYIIYFSLKLSVKNIPFIILISFFLTFIIYFSFSGFHNRFGGEFLLSFDSKSYQSNLFLDYFSNKPIIGQGFGFYIFDYVRNNSNPFVYENFLLSYLMQSGLIFTFIYILSFLIFSKFKIRFTNIFLVILALSYGFTNPVLVTPPMLILITYLMHNEI